MVYSRYRANFSVNTHKRDGLIDFVKGLLRTPYALHSDSTDGSRDTQSAENSELLASRYAAIFSRLEKLILEHLSCPETSKLRSIVPSIGHFFTPLPVEAAFKYVDKRDRISERREVPPSFNDVRRILNTAQVMASARDLKLITFDGDMTLYEDGGSLRRGSPLLPFLLSLLSGPNPIYVAIVTAAGYAEGTPYEKRLEALMTAFRSNPTKYELSRFRVLGGETNYLFQFDRDSLKLVPEPITESIMTDISDEMSKELLDVAEKRLRLCVDRMRLPADVLRKERACGLVPRNGVKIQREKLDECVLSVHRQVARHPHLTIPFCAFNGGSDVWVDVGNKLLGITLLRQRAGVSERECLHVGDQFLVTGNDYLSRFGSPTLWITGPDETRNMLELLTECRR